MYQECGAWTRGGKCTLWNYDAEYAKIRKLCLHFKEAVPCLLKKFTEGFGRNQQMWKHLYSIPSSDSNLWCDSRYETLHPIPL